jgi:hypothetical protein
MHLTACYAIAALLATVYWPDAVDEHISFVGNTAKFILCLR